MKKLDWHCQPSPIQSDNTGTAQCVYVAAPYWEFFLKIFVITVEGLEPASSCARDQDAITMTARHV